MTNETEFNPAKHCVSLALLVEGMAECMIRLKQQYRELLVDEICYKNNSLKCLIGDLDLAYLALKPGSSFDSIIHTLKTLQQAYIHFPPEMRHMAFESAKTEQLFYDHQAMVSSWITFVTCTRDTMHTKED